jgi:light-regulated signal transduction histidine kinase (bacteriophytochrome)
MSAERALAEELALANRDLESYSHCIAHDLRAPLRAIDAFSQILEEQHSGSLDEEAKRLVGVIRNGCRTMEQLISGLVEFSRAANETRHLSLDTVDMGALADAAASELARTYRRPEPVIDIGDVPEVIGDATALRQVWSNLIGNALKFSAKRSTPHVTISGHTQGGEVIYQVRDNGAGFDARYAQKLFGIFQRLHRSEEFAGIGVGLAIARRIVTRHGGRIWAEGAPDKGAFIQFALPLASATTETDRGYL